MLIFIIATLRSFSWHTVSRIELSASLFRKKIVSKKHQEDVINIMLICCIFIQYFGTNVV